MRLNPTEDLCTNQIYFYPCFISNNHVNNLQRAYGFSEATFRHDLCIFMNETASEDESEESLASPDVM